MRWNEVTENTENTFYMWHGSKRWDGSPEIRAPKAGRYEGGTGIYFTTHYNTASKYAKGGGSTMLAQIDSNIKLANKVLIPVETVVQFVRNCPKMRHKKEIITDLQNNASRKDSTSVYAEVLVNLVVNYEAGSGTVGVEVAKFLRENGVDALLDNRGSGEDWLVVINPKIIKSIKKVPAKDVTSDLYNLPPVKISV